MASADELKDQGNKAFAAGKFKEAVDLFTEAISLDSGNHVLFSNRSAAYASLKSYPAALTDAEKCVSIKPEWAKGYSRLGAALHGMNKMREARDAYEKGLALEPENKALKDGLESVKSKVEDGVNSMASIFAAPDAIEKLMKDKSTAAYMADPSFVAKINAIRANPGAVQGLMSDQRILQAMLVLMGMGAKVMTPDQFNAKDFNVEEDEEEMEADRPTAAAAAAAAPKPEAAKAEPAKAAEPEPEPMETDDGRPKISKEAKAKAAAEKEAGTAAYKKREFDDALKHYTAAVELDPTDMVFHLNISAVYYELKEFDKCIDVAVQAAQLGQDNQASFETIAKAYARASKAALAKDDLEDSLKHIKKALTNHRLAEYVATERALEKEIAERKRKAYLDPEQAVVHKNKGNDLFKAGDFPAALAEYTEALKRNPDDAKVYGNRAACYIKLAAFPLAIQDCETAIKLEPGFIKAYIRKGNGLVGMKKFSEAQSAFNRALEIDANNSEAHEGLAKCRDMMYKDMSTDERREAAMKDPEVQQILSDPVMNTILQQMTQDPKAARDHLKNPEIMRKLQKLINAGIVSTGSA